MSSIAPVLRAARSEVIPEVVSLAPGLPDFTDAGQVQHDVVQKRLVSSIISQGIDTNRVSPVDFNKLSRHTLVGSMINLQRKYLAEGEAEEAHFRPYLTAAGLVVPRGGSRHFQNDVISFQRAGFRHIHSAFSHGPTPETSWFPGLYRRYAGLGSIGLKITPAANKKYHQGYPYPDTPIPPEGHNLYRGLTTEALSDTVLVVTKLVRRDVKDPSERIKAAHDLVPQLLGGLASAHFYEMTNGTRRHRLQGEVVKNPKTEKYQLNHTPEQRRKVFPRIDDADLPNTRLKCPAHAAVSEGDTNMITLAHAAVNYAAENTNLLKVS